MLITISLLYLQAGLWSNQHEERQEALVDIVIDTTTVTIDAVEEDVTIGECRVLSIGAFIVMIYGHLEKDKNNRTRRVKLLS